VETVFDVALAYVEAQEPNSQSTSGLMVLYLIVERWLDLIEFVFSVCSLLIYGSTD